MSRKTQEQSKRNCEVISVETEKFIKYAKKLTRETVRDKAKAEAFMLKTGIYTKNGRLSKDYH